MDERSRFTLMQGIKSGSFSERQAFNALQAIKSDASNGEVADLIGSLAFSSLSKGMPKMKFGGKVQKMRSS